MKKIYLIIALTILTTSIINADVVTLSERQSVKLTQISSISDIINDSRENKYYVLYSYYNNKYYSENSESSTYVFGFTNTVSANAIVQLNVKTNTDNTYSVTIQANSGNYFAVSSTALKEDTDYPLITVEQSSAVSFTLDDYTTATSSANLARLYNNNASATLSSGQFMFTYTNNNNYFHLNGYDNFSVGSVYKNGNGANARQYIYKADIVSPYYSLKVIGAPYNSTITYTLNNGTNNESISANSTLDKTYEYDADDLIISGTPENYTTSTSYDENTLTYTVIYKYSGSISSSPVGKIAIYSNTFTDSNASTEISEGSWYILKRLQIDAYAYNNNGTYYSNGTIGLNNGGIISDNNKVYLFHFIKSADDNTYFIQNADGTFFGQVTNNQTITASNTAYPYLVDLVSYTGNTKDLYIKEVDNDVVIYNSKAGSAITGSTGAPSGGTGEPQKIWRLYPVTLVDYDNATWQTMANGASGNDREYTYYDIKNEKTIPVGAEVAEVPSLSNWALASNSDGGYYIINQYQYANDGNTLKYLTPSSIAENATVGFSATPQSWQTEKSETNEGVHIYLTDNGTTYYLIFSGVENNNKLILSTTAKNYWYFTEASKEINSSYLTALIGTAKVYSKNISSGYNKYTYYTDANKTTASTKDEFDKLIPADETSYANQAEVDVAYNKLNTTLVNTELNFPNWTTTSLIRIYYTPDGGTTKYYLSDGTSNKGESALTVTTTPDASTVWFYDSNGLWSYKSGFNLDCTNKTTAADVTAGIGFNEATGDVKGQGYYLIAGVNNGNTTNHLNISNSEVSFSSSESEAGHLNLEEVTSFDISLTQSNDGNYYASLYLPKAFTVSGATAYTGAVSDNTITLTALDKDTVIPANTAVIIVGSSSTATVTISSEKGSELTDNELSGQGTAKLVGSLAETGKTYCLGKKGNVVGFYTISNGYYCKQSLYK